MDGNSGCGNRDLHILLALYLMNDGIRHRNSDIPTGCHIRPIHVSFFLGMKQGQEYSDLAETEVRTLTENWLTSPSTNRKPVQEWFGFVVRGPFFVCVIEPQTKSSTNRQREWDSNNRSRRRSPENEMETP